MLNGRQWDIGEGITDAPRFLRLLAEHFPNASLLCAEGDRIASNVAALYTRHAAGGRNPAPRQGLARRYACRASPDFLHALAEAARGREPHEVLDHLFLYAGEQCLIEWHDAFANALVLSSEIPEQTVAALAQPFGVEYGRIE
jgi:hypothetical protein